MDLARVRGLRPPDRARLRGRRRRPARPCARRSPTLDGVGEVLEGESLAAAGLDHERSGELVVLAERDAWFTYHYWLDNAHAPDFGRQVEIHRKPGYDPAELFLDPDDEKGAKLRAAPGAGAQEDRHALRAVRRRASTRPSTSRARTGSCRPATRTGPCSCAARPRSRVTASPPPTCATCCSISPA